VLSILLVHELQKITQEQSIQHNLQATLVKSNLKQRNSHLLKINLFFICSFWKSQ